MKVGDLVEVNIRQSVGWPQRILDEVDRQYGTIVRERDDPIYKDKTFVVRFDVPIMSVEAFPFCESELKLIKK